MTVKEKWNLRSLQEGKNGGLGDFREAISLLKKW